MNLTCFEEVKGKSNDKSNIHPDDVYNSQMTFVLT